MAFFNSNEIICRLKNYCFDTDLFIHIYRRSLYRRLCYSMDNSNNNIGEDQEIAKEHRGLS